MLADDLRAAESRRIALTQTQRTTWIPFRRSSICPLREAIDGLSDAQVSVSHLTCREANIDS